MIAPAASTLTFALKADGLRATTLVRLLCGRTGLDVVLRPIAAVAFRCKGHIVIRNGWKEKQQYDNHY